MAMILPMSADRPRHKELTIKMDEIRFGLTGSFNGHEAYIATTVAEDCVLGISMAGADP